MPGEFQGSCRAVLPTLQVTRNNTNPKTSKEENRKKKKKKISHLLFSPKHIPHKEEWNFPMLLNFGCSTKLSVVMQVLVSWFLPESLTWIYKDIAFFFLNIFRLLKAVVLQEIGINTYKPMSKTGLKWDSARGDTPVRWTGNWGRGWKCQGNEWAYCFQESTGAKLLLSCIWEGETLEPTRKSKSSCDGNQPASPLPDPFRTKAWTLLMEILSFGHYFWTKLKQSQE